MKRKIAVFIMMILVVSVFAGCESGVEFKYASDEEKSYYYIDFMFDNTELSLLNGSSALRVSDYHVDGVESVAEIYWKVEDYLKLLMANFSGFEYQDKDDETDPDRTYYMFYREMERPDEEPEEEENDGLPEGYTLNKGLFIYTITVEQDNPFNEVRTAYNKNGASGIDAIDVFKYGASNPSNGKLLMPSFSAAFPAFSYVGTGDLTLNYFLQTNSKLITESNKFFYDYNGNKYYLFESSLNEDNGKITFKYYRANSLGWNILSVAIGFIVVGALILLAKYGPKKAPPPQRSRYRIYEYKKPDAPFGSDYENKNKNGNDKSSNDPFAGY